MKEQVPLIIRTVASLDIHHLQRLLKVRVMSSGGVFRILKQGEEPEADERDFPVQSRGSPKASAKASSCSGR